MRTSRPSPSINSGSMADIAFLLLIFFLVTTTISGDEGINRKLPKECNNCKVDTQRRNVLQIEVNNENKILINNEHIVELQDLKDIVKDFVDNNGDGSCLFCNGKQDKTSSDNPRKAVVSLQNSNFTTYKHYIAVQDEITKAYYELREHYSNETLQKDVKDLAPEEIKQVKEAYPFLLSEAQTE